MIKKIRPSLWINWSASKIKTYTLCPRLFLLMYVLGIKTPKLIWQAIGEIEHYLFKIGIRMNFKSVYSYLKVGLCYTTNYKNRGYKQKVLLRDVEERKIKKNKIGLMLCKLKAFYLENLDYHEVRKNKKIIKKSFFPIPETEKRIPFKYEGLEIVSKIDRINFVDDGYVIIDYKSSLDKPAVYNRDIQFTIYDIAATKKYDRQPKEILICTYIHPPKPKKEDASGEELRTNFEVVLDSLTDETLTEKEVHFRKMVDGLPVGKFEMTKIEEKSDHDRQKVLDLIVRTSDILKKEFEKLPEIKIEDLFYLDKIFEMRDGRHCHYCMHENNCQKIEKEGINSLYNCRA